MTRRETIPGPALQARALALASARVQWLLSGGDGAEPDLDAELAALTPLGPIGLATLVERFGLTALERDLFLLAAAQELGPEAAAALAAHPLSLQGRATPGLVLQVLGPQAAEVLGPQARLRQAALVELSPGTGMAQRMLTVNAAVAQYLHGAPEPSEPLAALLTPLAETEGDPAPLARAIRDARGHAGYPLIHLAGSDALAAERLAAGAFQTLGLCAFALDTGADMAPARLAALLNRDLVLLDGGLVMATGPEADALADRLTIPLVLHGAKPPRTRRAVATLPLPQPAPVDGLTLTAADRRDAQATHGLGLAPSVWTTARARAARALDGLAQPIVAQARWEDLVLPEAQMGQLRQLAAFQTHRSQVLDTWGFRAKSSRGLGLAALFSGPSGTGKTMAAEIVAAALGPGDEELGLYRVDLSAIVSKYIGETEKNIARIFDAAEDAGVVLIFDEGEALFGKRTSEVKDSLDRHANTETAYLLQRLEAYAGCAIVTTNLKATVDEAFLRRFRVVVDFPFPEAELRERIWRVVFPPESPLGDLDYAALSRLALSGGFIRSIALSAAFMAAGAGGVVTMALIARAARQEYTKLGKSAPESQMRAFR